MKHFTPLCPEYCYSSVVQLQSSLGTVTTNLPTTGPTTTKTLTPQGFRLQTTGVGTNGSTGTARISDTSVSGVSRPLTGVDSTSTKRI